MMAWSGEAWDYRGTATLSDRGHRGIEIAPKEMPQIQPSGTGLMANCVCVHVHIGG